MRGRGSGVQPGVACRDTQASLQALCVEERDEKRCERGRSVKRDERATRSSLHAMYEWRCGGWCGSVEVWGKVGFSDIQREGLRLFQSSHESLYPRI